MIKKLFIFLLILFLTTYAYADFDTATLAQAAFKRLFGKGMTEVKHMGGESLSSTYTLSYQKIIAENIPSTPPASSTSSILVCTAGQDGELNLTADVTSNGNAYWATVPSAGHALTGYINPSTGTNYANGDRVQMVIPTSFGSGYRPIPKNNGVEVTPLDSSDWFLDENAGVLFSETDLSLVSGTLACYVYVGDMLDDVWDQMNFTIYSDGTWDSEEIPIWISPADRNITIKQVSIAVMGTSTPSLTYNIEERAFASLASAGTDIYAADQAADATGEDETSFSNSGIAAKSHLVFTTGSSAESGTVTSIHGVIYYTRD